jgi:hypothetical protein
LTYEFAHLHVLCSLEGIPHDFPVVIARGKHLFPFRTE